MDIRVRARAHDRQRLVARGYGQLFEALRDSLYAYDPLCLGSGDLAKDEYGSPIVTIIPRLEKCSTPKQIQLVVEEEFRKHYPFQDVTLTNWEKLACDWWSIWSEFKWQRTLNLR